MNRTRPTSYRISDLKIVALNLGDDLIKASVFTELVFAAGGHVRTT